MVCKCMTKNNELFFVYFKIYSYFCSAFCSAKHSIVMFDFENTVAEIEWKVRKLIEENNRLRTVEAELTERCQQLQKEIDNNNIVINNLKEQQTIIKLGNALTQEGDSAEIKLKINQLIRSIDKTLLLINKTEAK